jgi:hypothetical protein
MNNLDIFLCALIIIIIFYFVIKNIIIVKKNNHFFSTQCKKGICYEKLDKCFSDNGYVYQDGSSDKKIERKTMKCILNTNDKYKLSKLENIFVPSMMNGTYCDIEE